MEGSGDIMRLVGAFRILCESDAAYWLKKGEDDMARAMWAMAEWALDMEANLTAWKEHAS